MNRRTSPPPAADVLIGVLLAAALAAFVILAMGRQPGAVCTTDSDCAARFGGDGGPAPAEVTNAQA